MFCHTRVRGHQLLGGSSGSERASRASPSYGAAKRASPPTARIPKEGHLAHRGVGETGKLRKLRFRRPKRRHSAHRDSIEHPERVTSKSVGQASWRVTSQTSRQTASLAGRPANPPRGASFEDRKETATVVYLISKITSEKKSDRKAEDKKHKKIISRNRGPDISGNLVGAEARAIAMTSGSSALTLLYSW